MREMSPCTLFQRLEMNMRAEYHGKIARYILIGRMDGVLQPAKYLDRCLPTEKLRSHVRGHVAQYELIAHVQESIVDASHDFKLNRLVGKWNLTRQSKLAVQGIKGIYVTDEQHTGREQGRVGRLSKELVAVFFVGGHGGIRVTYLYVQRPGGRGNDTLQIRLHDGKLLAVNRQVHVGKRRCRKDARGETRPPPA